jgi:hypothetical protein
MLSLGFVGRNRSQPEQIGQGHGGQPCQTDAQKFPPLDRSDTLALGALE